MTDRYALVPVDDTAQEALDRVLDAFGQSGVSLAECLDTDAVALSASDMRYFPKEYYGKVPTYAVFMRYLNKQQPAVRDSFMSMVAEIESAHSAQSMAKLANSDSIGLEQVRRFNMMKDLNKLAEKRIDRIDRRTSARANEAERGVDLAARLITALSNADLLKIKGRAEAIDAEFKSITIAKEGE